jgi:branched-chain amino acid aminotransferase
MSDGAHEFSEGAAYVEGKFVPIREARVPILDWGFVRSDATYDVAHVWQGRFYRLKDHIKRFERSVAKLRMKLPVSGIELHDVLMQSVRLTGFTEAYVEMICTRGVPPPGSRDPRQCQNALFAFAVPFVWIADPEKQKRGLSLRISNVTRIPPGSVDPTVKNYHWHDLTRGIFEAFDEGDETAVLTDGLGHVVEGPGFNIFCLSKGKLATPSDGMLEGITRRTILELAGSAGIEVDERIVSVEELRSADEIFITSTAGGVMPITRVDGVPVRTGVPGVITLDLRERYWRSHSDPKYSEQVCY